MQIWQLLLDAALVWPYVGVWASVHIVPEVDASSHCCRSEPFHHYYVGKNRELLAWNNTWIFAAPGAYADLRDVCLWPNGLPVTRRCDYNQQTQTAEWEDISGWDSVACYRETHEIIITPALHMLDQEIVAGKRLGKGAVERQQVASQVCELLSRPAYRLLPGDVVKVSKIVQRLTSEERDANISRNVMHVMSTLMSSDADVLRLSAELNATNSLLDTFETYMDDLCEQYTAVQLCQSDEHVRATNGNQSFGAVDVQTMDFAPLGVHAELSQQVSVFFVNPRCANVSGIAIYKRGKQTGRQLFTGPLGHFKYGFLYMNESELALLQENTNGSDMLAATFLTSPVWEYVESELRSASATRQRRQPRLVIKFYYNDLLFVERRSQLKQKTFSKILSISIPGFSGYFPESVKPPSFFLRNINLSKLRAAVILNDTGCAFWNYTGWSSEGVQTLSENVYSTGELIRCRTTHLTQFGFLVGGSYRQDDLSHKVSITPVTEQVLDFISLVGCTLSLLGLLGIWLTAMFVPKWRANVQIKLLLNLCVALSLQMVLFVFVNTDGMSAYLVHRPDMRWMCTTLGALLQYSILVMFMWMLSMAYLQFQRYVTVLGAARPSHYVLKSALIAWGVPLIPTLLAATLAPQLYIPNDFQLRTDTGICYPTGKALAYGVILPAAVIAITNLLIFVNVLYNVHLSLSQPIHRTERKVVRTQIQFYVFLFFVLGLPWLFGILSFMGAGSLFSYLFCLTATIQGFVLFIYYVLFNSVARSEWARLLHIPNRTRKHQGSSEQQSITSRKNLTKSLTLESSQRSQLDSTSHPHLNTTEQTN